MTCCTPTQAPTTYPTASDVAALGRKIANDSIEAVAPEVRDIVNVADESGICPASVDVLQDPTAPQPLKERAFAVIARRWPEITAKVIYWRDFQHSLDQLVNQWTEHQTLRNRADTAELWKSRTKLDELRLKIAIERRSQPEFL